MEIRKTRRSDISDLMDIFDEARKTIAALGIDQWQNGYPSESVITKDVDESRSYCVERDGKICATFAMITDGEPTYNQIFCGKWLTGDAHDTYFALHRVAISVQYRGSGISGEIIEYARGAAQESGKKSLRIDTHKGNLVMRKMLEKNGFIYCGVIYLENGDERVAYERLI